MALYGNYNGLVTYVSFQIDESLGQKLIIYRSMSYQKIICVIALEREIHLSFSFMFYLHISHTHMHAHASIHTYIHTYIPTYIPYHTIPYHTIPYHTYIFDLNKPLLQRHLHLRFGTQFFRLSSFCPCVLPHARENRRDAGAGTPGRGLLSTGLGVSCSGDGELGLCGWDVHGRSISWSCDLKQPDWGKQDLIWSFDICFELNL